MQTRSHENPFQQTQHICKFNNRELYKIVCQQLNPQSQNIALLAFWEYYMTVRKTKNKITGLRVAGKPRHLAIPV